MPNVNVEDKVLEKLKEKKKEFGAKSLNEVINLLLERVNRE